MSDNAPSAPPYSAPYPTAQPPPYADASASAPAPDDSAALAFCLEHGFPRGLAEAAIATKGAFARRYWILDNSGSMSIPDGHRLESTAAGDEKLVSCSRWHEVEDMVQFHAGFAASLGAPTEFRFLNPPRTGRQTVVVQGSEDLPHLHASLSSGPAGGTPLCQHVREVGGAIASIEHELRASGQQVVLTIVTDGLPSDGDLTVPMQALARLPVWIVVRLCTDEQNVLDFWNSMDSALECDIEVLDDLAGEAAECAQYNSWLTYGPPLHRVREWGMHHKLFDLLDERKLAPTEVRELAAIVIGGGQLPHPEIDSAGLVEDAVRRQLDLEQPFNPVRKRRTPWIDERRLRRALRTGHCCVS